METHRRASVSGFTLIELLIVLALLSILALQVAPAARNLIDHAQTRASLNELIGLINLGRSTSVYESTITTLCPVDAELKCSKDWSNPIALFTDPEKHRRVTNEDLIIRVISPPKHGQLSAKTGVRRYFSFQPNGMARHAIGSILWCPPDGDSSKAVQIRINMGGRPRLAQDTNGDGVVEGSDGKPVICA